MSPCWHKSGRHGWRLCPNDRPGPRHQSMLQSEEPDQGQSGQCHSRPLPNRAHTHTHIQTLTPSHIDFRSILGAAKHQTLQFVIQQCHLNMNQSQGVSIRPDWERGLLLWLFGMSRDSFYSLIYIYEWQKVILVYLYRMLLNLDLKGLRTQDQFNKCLSRFWKHSYKKSQCPSVRPSVRLSCPSLPWALNIHLSKSNISQVSLLGLSELTFRCRKHRA